jgi:hypothetical protein
VLFALGMLSSGIAHAASSVSATATNDPFCAAPLGNGKQGIGTLKMVARLSQNAERAHPADNQYVNDLAVQALTAALAVNTNPARQLSLQLQRAIQLVQAGESAAAIREFNEVETKLRSTGMGLSRPDEMYLQLQRGIAHLRLGEQENCLANHSSQSCLFPIEGSGIHKLPQGSRNAIEAFTALLQVQPQDLGLRWLLNIAYMTLGEYPAKVPVQWLIPPRVFASDYPLPRFPDTAGAAGLDLDDVAGGCVVDDLDGDGLLDVLVSSWKLKGQLRFFHNNGDGSFAERTKQAGLSGLVGGLNLMQTDFNNDGWLDVFILRGAWLGKAGRHPNSLLRNNGDGTFEDVTEEAGLLSFHPTQTATWFDFDGDGWVDLFIGNESIGAERHPSELYRNNGNGTFTECAAAAGINVAQFVKGVTSGDYDNDGLPDLYVSCRDGLGNHLFRNLGRTGDATNAARGWSFADVSAQAGLADPIKSFPTWFFDYDNDGFLDVLVTGYTSTMREIAADALSMPHAGERSRLYHNDGNGKFSDVTKKVGLFKVLHAMGANYGDFDNDGWLDFYVGTGDPELSTLIPNRAFRNDGGTNFQDVTTATGMGHLQKGHGIAFADLDHDGDQDVYAVMGGAYTGDNYRNALFLNPGSSNQWVTLQLQGKHSNRAAIGARIHVTVATERGPRSIHRTVSSGGSFGASPLRQHIGLGSARKIERMEIRWPGRVQPQVVEGVAMGRFYRIVEGNAPQFVDLKPIALGKAAAMGHGTKHHAHEKAP